VPLYAGRGNLSRRITVWYVPDQPYRCGAFLNFLPSWWHNELGIDFGKRYYYDPAYRAEAVGRMQRHLCEILGDLGFGDAGRRPVPTPPDWYNATMPMFFGCTVTYSDHNFPASFHLDDKRLRELKAPDDLDTNPLVSLVKEQVETINKTFGTEMKPAWSPNGVLNVCVLLQGADFLADLMLGHEGALRLMDVAQETLERSVDWMIRHKSQPPMLIHANCTVAMISPQLYEKAMLPREKQLESFARSRGLTYGIHHCGPGDPYLDMYRELPRLDSLELGWETHLKGVAEKFPETGQFIYNFDHRTMMDASLGEIRGHVERILDDFGDIDRLAINFASNEAGTPLENVRAGLSVLKDL